MNTLKQLETNTGRTAFLEACSHHYDCMTEMAMEFSRKASPEATLIWVQQTAAFSAMHHPGRFYDGTLENLALKVGRNLSDRPCRPHFAAKAINDSGANRHAIRRVLHVTTVVHPIGGHARTILNWIKKDATSIHSLVTTTSEGVEISKPFRDAIFESGGDLVVLPDSATLCSRAAWLRKYATEAADVVFLHLTPYDVVPIVAFSLAGGPPVSLINLADQCYWIGSTIADSVVHLREIGEASSAEIRHTRNNLKLPIPLTEPEGPLSKSLVRDRLGIPLSRLMLLCIGRKVKFAPSERKNFFLTARKLLERNKEAHLYIVGVCAEDYGHLPNCHPHERMHFVGPIDDATPYQWAADLYLEGFPFGSQTALLEAILPGTPCVTAFAPDSALLATEDFSLRDLVSTPRNEEEYIQRASDFIRNTDLRAAVGIQLRKQVLHFHVESSWNKYLESVYKGTITLAHLPREIPRSRASTRDVDLAISEYHSTRFASPNKLALLDREVRNQVFDAAYAMRQRKLFMDAFRLLRLFNRNRPWDVDSIIFSMKLLVHWVMSLPRQRNRYT